jgi:hypothetical protein
MTSRRPVSHFRPGKNGELISQWNDIPSAEELAAALSTSPLTPRL